MAKLSKPASLSDVFAWYVVSGALATAAGNLISGWATQSLQDGGWSEVASYRLVFCLYAVIGLVKAGVTLLLSKNCEVDAPEPKEDSERSEESERFLSDQATTSATQRPQPQDAKKNRPKLSQISLETRIFLVKFCFLTFLDSFASGMVPLSLLALFMDTKFGIPEGTLGTIMGSSQFVAGVSNIFASSLARRIGYIKTMAFTHLPSAIFLGLIPAPQSLVLTVMLIVARYGLASMDQGPRTAFLAAAVKPEERTAVMGILGTVRTACQSSGPLITGLLAGGGRFWVAFVAAGSMKAAYDVGLLAMFVNMRIEGDMPDRVKLGTRNDPAEGERFELPSEGGSSEYSESDARGPVNAHNLRG